jgi:hypothetical protein
MYRRTWGVALFALGLVGLSSACLSTRGPSVAEQAVAPSFRLKSHLGGEVALEDLLAKGPAVVVFYRGQW